MGFSFQTSQRITKTAWPRMLQMNGVFRLLSHVTAVIEPCILNFGISGTPITWRSVTSPSKIPMKNSFVSTNMKLAWKRSVVMWKLKNMQRLKNWHWRNGVCQVKKRNYLGVKMKPGINWMKRPNGTKILNLH